MKPEVFKAVIDQLSDRRRNIGLTIMGEPLINKNIVEFITYAKSKGHGVSLTTNGTLLSEQKSRDMIAAGLDALTVSFDGATKETYERIRIGAVYEDVVKNTRQYKELKDKLNPASKLHIHCILSALTQHEQDAFRALWEPHCDHISFLQLDDWVGQMELPPEFGFEPAEFTLPEKVPYGCHLLWNTISIGANGSPIYCCFDYKLRSNLPSVLTKTIRETWDDELAGERLKHLNNTVDSEPCLSCKHWSRIRYAKDFDASRPMSKLKKSVKKIFSLIEVHTNQ